MNTSKISVRYAKALLSLAVEENKQKEINEDVKFFFYSCDVIEFNSILENPVISMSKKKSVIQALFAGKVSDFSIRFINLLIDNRREARLKNICRMFLLLYRQKYNIKQVTLITAVEFDKKLTGEISKIIEGNFKSDIEIETKTDSAIIGGFIMNIEDKQYDASIHTKLDKIKRELLQVSI